jgi:superfamily I DNA and/or RNA helicase
LEILNDKRRLTVAITRAKEKLILVGSSNTLKRYKPVENIINCVKNNDLFYEICNMNEIFNLENI